VDDGVRTHDGLPRHDWIGERTVVAAPDDVDVWIGLDVGKDAHFAEILDNDGDRLYAHAVAAG
jgi:hypothetical protein